MDIYEKLKEKNIEVGDKIKINNLIGILMPKQNLMKKTL